MKLKALFLELSDLDQNSAKEYLEFLNYLNSYRKEIKKEHRLALQIFLYKNSLTEKLQELEHKNAEVLDFTSRNLSSLNDFNGLDI